MAKKVDNGQIEAMRTFKRDLKANTLGRCYLLHGEESYLREHYVGMMREKLLPQGMEDFNLHVLQGKDTTVRAIGQAVDCLPMMGERTLVLVYDYELGKLGDDQREELMALLEDLPDYVCLAFVFDLVPLELDARTKLAGVFKKCAQNVKFVRQEQGDLVDWICRRFRALDHDIDSELARYLIFYCGDLMQGLVPEIGKIGSYAQHRAITKADIEAVATPQLDAVIFQLTDAITTKNYDLGARVLADLLHMGEPAIRIHAILGKQLRQLYTARLLYERRRGKEDLVALWKMHAYPAGKLMDAARRYDLDWCRHALVLAADTDLALKTVSASEMPAVMTDLLLGLANG